MSTQTSFLLKVLIFAVGTLSSLAANSGMEEMSGSAERHDQLAQVDYTLLEEEASLRFGVPDEVVARMVRRNFHYLYLNRLNERRFLVSPKPQRVVARIATLLALNRQLSASIKEARASIKSEGGPGSFSRRDRLQVISEIGRLASECRKTFRTHFIELKMSTEFVINLADHRSPARFLRFVLEAERIDRLLTKALNDYFFNDNPGLVTVGHYERFSIDVLCQALITLAEASRERLES